jgi:uroporphyrinogen decarboxylase
MEETKGGLDAFLSMTDLGSQDRLLLSRRTRERFIYPMLRRLSEVVHGEGVRLMFHSCGAIREVMPELIDCGVDILNPLQPGAKGMEPKELKKEFGEALVFHGAIDIQYLLPLESAESVREETNRRIQLLGESGGYILAPSHNLQEDIPLENIKAMYEVNLRY